MLGGEHHSAAVGGEPRGHQGIARALRWVLRARLMTSVWSHSVMFLK